MEQNSKHKNELNTPANAKKPMSTLKKQALKQIKQSMPQLFYKTNFKNKPKKSTPTPLQDQPKNQRQHTPTPLQNKPRSTAELDHITRLRMHK